MDTDVHSYIEGANGVNPGHFCSTSHSFLRPWLPLRLLSIYAGWARAPPAGALRDEGSHSLANGFTPQSSLRICTVSDEKRAKPGALPPPASFSTSFPTPAASEAETCQSHPPAAAPILPTPEVPHSPSGILWTPVTPSATISAWRRVLGEGKNIAGLNLAGPRGAGSIGSGSPRGLQPGGAGEALGRGGLGIPYPAGCRKSRGSRSSPAPAGWVGGWRPGSPPRPPELLPGLGLPQAAPPAPRTERPAPPVPGEPRGMNGCLPRASHTHIRRHPRQTHGSRSHDTGFTLILM